MNTYKKTGEWGAIMFPPHWPRPNSLHLLGVLFVAVCLAPSTSTEAAPRDRVPRAIDDSKRTIVVGNIHPGTKRFRDNGQADPAAKLSRLAITFRMTAEQQAELSDLIAQQHDRFSPDYHKWLTPEQFGDRFGLSEVD